MLADAEGSLAICASAGSGQVPPQALDGRADPEAAFRRMDDLIDRLPRTGSHSVEGRGPGNETTWRALADRGFYVYDWRLWNGPYERILRPDRELRVEALGAEERRVLVTCNLRFRETASFRLADLP